MSSKTSDKKSILPDFVNLSGTFLKEVRNSRVTKSRYAKSRHTLSYLLENFYRSSSFELLTQLCKILNFTSSYLLEVGK